MDFNGYDCKITRVNGNTVIECKGIIGTLDQLLLWLSNHKKDPYKTYYFGRNKPSKIEVQGSKVKIGCLEDNYQKFVKNIKSIQNGI